MTPKMPRLSLKITRKTSVRWAIFLKKIRKGNRIALSLAEMIGRMFESD